MIAAVQTKGRRRGKSGLHRAGCQITSGGGNSQDSATEIYRVSNETRGHNKMGRRTLACRQPQTVMDMRRMPRNEERTRSE